jgi:hypothetical protein
MYKIFSSTSGAHQASFVVDTRGSLHEVKRSGLKASNSSVFGVKIRVHTGIPPFLHTLSLPYVELIKHRDHISRNVLRFLLSVLFVF